MGEALLARALVGDEHREQYLTDANFHSAVCLLARMLPLWVDALADCKASMPTEQIAAIRAYLAEGDT
jgi:hypothetical protein